MTIAPYIGVLKNVLLDSEQRRLFLDRQKFKRVTSNIVQNVRPYTMVPAAGIEFMVKAVRYVSHHEVPGAFVECGVWQGGSASAMLLAQRALLSAEQQRTVHLFDSFEGLPAAQAADGPHASEWQSNTDSPGYHDNCAASLEHVERNLQTLGLLDPKVIFHKGWFEETVPQWTADNQDTKVAVLRLDGDWYESTKICIESLYPLVSENGIIVIDDYYAWDGCAQAIHEFLGNHKLNHRLRPISNFSGAYFIKQPWRRKGFQIV